MPDNVTRPATVAMDRAGPARSAATVLAVDDVAAEVITALDDACIRSLLLKGPVVAAWLYASTEVRPYIDVDLLVPVEERPAAEEVLSQLGFRYVLDGVHPLEEAHHARTWLRGSDASIDLHTTLSTLAVDPRHTWAVLNQGAGKLTVGGVLAAVPGPAALALIVALHAIRNGPDDAKVIDELARAITVADLDFWREVADLATQLDAGGLLRAALELLPPGVVVANELGLPSIPVRAAILTAGSPDARACALVLDRIGASPSWRQKAAMLARLLVPTPSYLRATPAGDVTGRFARYGRRWSRLKSALRGYVIWRSAVRNCGASRRLTDRLEVVAWSLATRILVATVGLNRALRLLDGVKIRRSGDEHLAATERDALFRLAGRCLGEAVARSEYLGGRGQPHELVLGVAGSGDGFRAHAWLEPLDTPPAGFHALHRYSR